MKKLQDFRRMSDTQLRQTFISLSNDLMRAKTFFKGGGGMVSPIGFQATDTMFIRRVKRDRARILTILRERELKREKQHGRKEA